MQACLHPPVEHSKAYYHATYPEPPVLHELLEGMKLKNIRFSLFIGDMPTYKHTVEQKAENSQKSKDIIPILGPFHQQCSFIYSIYSGNAQEYLSSTHGMLKYLMAYNNHEYGRWLPDYWASINSLPPDQYKFFEENFSQSMTGLTYSLQAMDLWIESMNLG